MQRSWARASKRRWPWPCAGSARTRSAPSSRLPKSTGLLLNLGDVVLLDLGLPSGRAAGFRHPAVVVTAQRILNAGPSVAHVVPLTLRIRQFGSEVRIDPDAANGLEQPSAAQCQYLRAVSTGRIERVCGNVGVQALTQLREVISLILDLMIHRT